jgi:signal transduction histidine kinase
MLKKPFLTLFFCLCGIVCQAVSDSLLMSDISRIGVLMQEGQFDSALVRATRLLPSARENSNALAQATLHNAIGSCLMRKGNRDLALQAFMRSSAIVEQNDILQVAINDKTGNLFSVFATMYGQMSLHYHNVKNSVEALHYARIALRWLSYTDNKALRVVVMSYIVPALDASKDWRVCYELLKKSFADASELGLSDFALQFADCLIRCEDEAFGRGPDAYSWIEDADAILPRAMTDEAKSAYMRSRDAILSKYGSRDGVSLPTANQIALKGEQSDTIHAGGTKDEQSLPAVAQEVPFTADADADGDEAFLLPSVVAIRKLVLVLTILVLCFLCAVYFLWRRRSDARKQRDDERRLAEKYVEGREDERNRLARELHDGVSNQLLAVEMKLSTDGLTTQTMQLLNESREQVRRVSHELIQPEFAHSSLDEVLVHYASEICGAGHCEVSCNVTPPDADWRAIPDTVALEIYRVVQEVVSNAMKHAGVSVVSIGLHQDEKQNIMLIISDNGAKEIAKPLSAVQGVQSNGIGLRTIRQRVSAIGGTVETFHHQYGNVFKLVVMYSKVGRHQQN